MKLMRHQKDAIDFINSHPVGGVFLPTGTGKTRTILAWIQQSKMKTLLVVPLPLISSWLEENRKSGTNLKIQNLRSGKFSIQPDAWIVNLESLDKAVPHKRFFDCVVIEESTKIANRTSQRSRKLYKEFGQISRKYLISGNPVPRDPTQIFGQYLFLDSNIFGRNYYSFMYKYFRLDHWKRPYFSKVAQSYFISKELEHDYNEKFHSIAFVRKKSECVDLPPKVYKTSYVELSGEQLHAYKEMQRNMVLQLADTVVTSANACAKGILLAQICSGFVYVKNQAIQFANNVKRPVLESIIETLVEESGQAGVWCWFQEDVRMISSWLKDKYSLAEVYGGLAMKQQIENRQAFQRKERQIFIATVAAGGLGINEFTECEGVVYYNTPYSTELRQQSEDRTHRYGAKGSLYWDIVIKNTIDEVIYESQKNKLDISQKILYYIKNLLVERRQ